MLLKACITSVFMSFLSRNQPLTFWKAFFPVFNSVFDLHGATLMARENDRFLKQVTFHLLRLAVFRNENIRQRAVVGLQILVRVCFHLFKFIIHIKMFYQKNHWLFCFSKFDWKILSYFIIWFKNLFFLYTMFVPHFSLLSYMLITTSLISRHSSFFFEIIVNSPPPLWLSLVSSSSSVMVVVVVATRTIMMMMMIILVAIVEHFWWRWRWVNWDIFRIDYWDFFIDLTFICLIF